MEVQGCAQGVGGKWGIAPPDPSFLPPKIGPQKVVTEKFPRKTLKYAPKMGFEHSYILKSFACISPNHAGASLPATPDETVRFADGLRRFPRHTDRLLRHRLPALSPTRPSPGDSRGSLAPCSDPRRTDSSGPFKWSSMHTISCRILRWMTDRLFFFECFYVTSEILYWN